MQKKTLVKAAAVFMVAVCISPVYGGGNTPLPAFSFKYGGKRLAGSASMQVDAHLKVTVESVAYPQFDATEWVLWFENPSAEKSAILSEIRDGNFLVSLPPQPKKFPGDIALPGERAVVTMNGCVSGIDYATDDAASAREFAAVTRTFHPWRGKGNVFEISNGCARPSDRQARLAREVRGRRGGRARGNWTLARAVLSGARREVAHEPRAGDELREGRGRREQVPSPPAQALLARGVAPGRARGPLRLRAVGRAHLRRDDPPRQHAEGEGFGLRRPLDRRGLVRQQHEVRRRLHGRLGTLDGRLDAERAHPPEGPRGRARRGEGRRHGDHAVVRAGARGAVVQLRQTASRPAARTAPLLRQREGTELRAGLALGLRGAAQLLLLPP